MTRKLRYAPAGYAYYHVATPSVFREILLPEDHDMFDSVDERQYDRLIRLAEMHGTRVVVQPFAAG